jgi:tetratricopeptide (TPR) repeat protein
VTSAKQVNNLFMVKSSNLIKELVARGIGHAADSQQGLAQLAHTVVAVAEHAYIRRDVHTLKESSDLLLALPVTQAQRAGLWYRAALSKWEGRLSEASNDLKELFSDQRTAPRFRARALQVLGRIHHLEGDLGAARQLYLESAKYIKHESPHDAYIFVDSVFLHSVVQGEEGDSRQALRELLSIEPIINILRHPLLTANYFNNVAVELLELGRVSEASRYSRVACASPLAYAYPVYNETALQIRQRTARRDSVAVAADVAVSPEPEKRPPQPKYLLVVLRFSPRRRRVDPVSFRPRVSCNNPVIALVAHVAQIRAPSFLIFGRSPISLVEKSLGRS